MSALQFLNKKSWHVSTLRNSEKVWQAEQKKLEEDKKLDELKTQLDHERHIQQLELIQTQTKREGDGSGQDALPKLKRKTGLEWMYNTEAASGAGNGKGDKDGMNPIRENRKERSNQEKEDLLLGKKSVAMTETNEALRRKNEADLLRVVGSVGMRDAEAKLREDPMLMIMKQEIKEVENGPVSHEKENILAHEKRKRKKKQTKSEESLKVRHREKHRKLRQRRKAGEKKQSSKKRGSNHRYYDSYSDSESYFSSTTSSCAEERQQSRKRSRKN